MSTSSSHYFREAIRGAERCGLDGERLLTEIGVTRIQIEDPTWRGKSEQLARLVSWSGWRWATRSWASPSIGAKPELSP